MEYKYKLFAAAGLKHNNQKAYLTKSNHRKIKEVHIHPEFKGGKRPVRTALEHDLAVVELREGFKLGDDIAPGCLYPNREKEFEGNLLAAGFGDVTDYDPRPSEPEEPIRGVQTNPASMAYVKQTPDCPDSLTSFERSTMLCAVSSFSSIKRGDRGGALLHESEGKLFIVGVLSQTFPGDSPASSPNIYSLVQPHLNWIKQKVSDERCLTDAQVKINYFFGLFLFIIFLPCLGAMAFLITCFTIFGNQFSSLSRESLSSISSVLKAKRAKDKQIACQSCAAVGPCFGCANDTPGRATGQRMKKEDRSEEDEEKEDNSLKTLKSSELNK